MKKRIFAIVLAIGMVATGCGANSDDEDFEEIDETVEEE